MMYRILAHTRLVKLIGLKHAAHSYLLAIAALISLAAIPAAFGQTTWYVDDDAPADPGPGDPTISDPLEDGSADHPFDAIQEAIDAATDGDTVLVADGTYTGVGNKNLDYGGKAITVRSENGPDTCVIDCENDGRGFYFQCGEPLGTIVEGFTIRNGLVIDDGEPEVGSGCCVSYGSPTIRNCVITANTGAAVYCRQGSPTIDACVISGNTSEDACPGILCSEPTLLITNCTIVENTGTGGAVKCRWSPATIRNCTISGNVIGDEPDGAEGAAVWYNYGGGSIEDCTIEGNVAHGIWAEEHVLVSHCRIVDNHGRGIQCAGQSVASECLVVGSHGDGIRAFDNTAITSCTSFRNHGAGIRCFGSSIVTSCTTAANRGPGIRCSGTTTVTGCLIRENAAESGGGVSCGSGSPQFLNCEIGANTAADEGGGIYSDDGSPTFTNCVITQNQAARGAGVYCYSSDAAFVNCTLSANQSNEGGGIHCYRSSPTIANCILWNNGPSEISTDEGDPVLTYTDVAGGWPGEGNIDIDPQSALPDDPRLMPGSPCIDAGTNEPPMGLPTGDFDGNPRAVDGDGDSSAVADMGAFEFDPAAPAIACGPHVFAFTGQAGEPDPREWILGIRNCGSGTLNWEIVADCPWLGVEPGAGQSTGEIDEVQISVDLSELPPGEYVRALTVDDPEAVNTPQTVSVVFRLWSGCPIQPLIDAADDGDTVIVADGVYTGLDNKNLDFGGKAITLRSAGGPENCIINCESSGRGFHFHSGEGADSVVDGFTVTNGYVDPMSEYGGAIFCENGSNPTFVNCVIAQSAAGYGGGIACVDSSPTMIDCTISGNVSEWFGGGVFCEGLANLVIANCTIIANTAGHWAPGGGVCCLTDSDVVVTGCTISGNTGSGGGGVCYWGDGDLVVADCTVSENSVEGSGGGVQYGEGGRLTISNCTITHNAAGSNGPGLGGGGVRCYGEASIVNSTISGNTALPGGGIYCSGHTSIANCEIAGNQAGYDGGGLMCDGTTVIANCEVAGNVAGYYGGGLMCYGSTAIANCTIGGNTASSEGGGVRVLYDNPSISSSVLWGNSAPLGPAISVVRDYSYLTTLSVSHSDIQGAEEAVHVDDGCTLIWGDGNIDAGPLFTDPNSGDYHVLPSSPCIDAGCNCAVPEDFADLDGDGVLWEYVPFDLDGEGRFFDDPDTPDSGSGLPPIVDMGAYEFGGSDLPPCHGDLDGDRDVDLDDLAVLLAHYGTLEGANGADGDMDCDGDIQIADLAEFLGAYGDVCE